jgi:hypothetical protein
MGLELSPALVVVVVSWASSWWPGVLGLELALVVVRSSLPWSGLTSSCRPIPAAAASLENVRL